MASDRMEFTSSKKPGAEQKGVLITNKPSEEQEEGIGKVRNKLATQGTSSGMKEWYGKDVVRPRC